MGLYGFVFAFFAFSVRYYCTLEGEVMMIIYFT